MKKTFRQMIEDRLAMKLHQNNIDQAETKAIKTSIKVQKKALRDKAAIDVANKVADLGR